MNVDRDEIVVPEPIVPKPGLSSRSAAGSGVAFADVRYKVDMLMLRMVEVNSVHTFKCLLQDPIYRPLLQFAENES